MKNFSLKKLIIWIFVITYFVPFVFTIPLGIISSIFFSEDSGNNPFDYARITDVDYKAVLVDEDYGKNKLIITERLTYDIHAASKNNLFWELWRDLPESYVDGVKVDYKVNSVKQIIDDEIEVVYKESPRLYWEDEDYTDTSGRYGPGKWYHSEGPYDEENRDYECVFFYVDGLYREQVVFEIEYEMNNAALRYNDCSELYISLYSEETVNHLKSFNAQILIPEKDMPDKGNYTAHTYGTDANEFKFTESKVSNPGYHTFSFELDENDLKFSPYNEYIEFSLVSFGADKHIFTDYAPYNDYSLDNVLDEIKFEQNIYEATPGNFLFFKIILFSTCIIIALIIIVRTLSTDKRLKKKHNFYEPSTPFEFFRDIPSNLDPNFAEKLVFCKDKKAEKDADGYAAIMLSLVHKKYIELAKIDDIKDWDFNNVKIVVKYNPIPVIRETIVEQTTIVDQINKIITPDDTAPIIENIETTTNTEPITNIELPKLEPLTKTEEYYFNLIYRHSKGTEISMKDFQDKVSTDYDNTDTFVRNVEKSVVDIGISQGYFQKSKYDEPKQKLKSSSSGYLVWGFILLILFNFIFSLTRIDLAFGGFTILGITLLVCSIYLKKICNKYILLTQFGEDEYAKWRGLYNFLNSETLINERTIIELPLWEKYLIYATAFGISEKVIKAIKIRCPEIDIETSPILGNSYYRSVSFRTSSRSFRTATRSASYTSRSGGFGGHGGYGGGGRGGGGGRRRSLIYNIKGMNLIKIHSFFLSIKKFSICISLKLMSKFCSMTFLSIVLYIVFEIYFSAIFKIYL